MIGVDTHEPSEIVRLLEGVMPVYVDNLNDQDLPDYIWDSPFGGVGIDRVGQADLRTGVERKTWRDLLININPVEEQVRREILRRNCRLILVIEGIVIPIRDGTTTLVAVPDSKNYLHRGGFRNAKPMQHVYSWLYQASKYMEVHYTPNRHATAMALVAFYNGDQRREHTTFHRHLKNITFSPNPQVQMLMNLLPNVGEVRASVLIEKFGTVWAVVSASPQDLATVEGIGLNTAKKLLASIGRIDV